MIHRTNSKVPKIRFKGFVEAWVVKTLGALGSVAMNKRVFKHQTTTTGDVPFYKIGTFGKEPDSFISRKLFIEYKSKFSYPSEGDLLISASGSIGRIVEYGGKDEYFQDSNIVWLQHDGAVVNAFLKQFYSFVKWAGLEGSTIKRLYNKNILETPIVLPDKDEQTQIGGYFREVDRLIGLQQRKHDKLVTLKKAMLHAMFPQPGTTTPEIRFKGFEGAWEEKKLADVCFILNGYAFKSIDFDSTKKNKVIRMSDLKSGSISKEDHALVSDELVTGLERFSLEHGDLLFGMSGSLSNYAWVIREDLPAFLNQRVGCIRKKDGNIAQFVQYIYCN